MGISPDKRMLLAKVVAKLPNLSGASAQEAESASRARIQILELLLDRFITPDNADLTTSSATKRAKQLWKSLVAEKRSSYFIDLKASHYVEWIKTGEAFVLPCTTDEVEERNRVLPELKGSETVVNLAKEIRATFMKYSDLFEQLLLVRGVPAEKRRKLEMFRDILRKVDEAEWFIMRQPKEFTEYERLFGKLIGK